MEITSVPTEASKLPERLLRVEQVAEVLNISKAQVYRLIKSGQIPAKLFGKSVRIRRIDLVNLIDGPSETRLNNQNIG